MSQRKIKALLKSADDKSALFLRLSGDRDTANFLNTYRPFKNRTITADTFKVKITKSSPAVAEYTGKIVELTISIKNYMFFVNGKKIDGWNMELMAIESIE